MILLKDLSEEARGTLVKAIPLYRQKEFWEDKEYIKLYQDFMTQTKTVKEPIGFNQFNRLCLAMKRSLKINPYTKENSVEEDIVRKDVRETFANFRNQKWRVSYAK